jgi:hypothetical protein
MAFECFNKFKEDKGIEGWQTKLLSGGLDGNINLSSLDFLLSQMSAMRDIVNQYYKFIAAKVGRGNAYIPAEARVILLLVL